MASTPMQTPFFPTHVMLILLFTPDTTNFFHHVCSFHITEIIHGNYHQTYLLVLSILCVAAWTARYSAPTSIYDGASAVLVQPSFTLWKVMIDAYSSFPTQVNLTQNRSSYWLYF
jgi:hypothetical protein